jgi:hypothetical protein
MILDKAQQEACDRLKDGNILCGSVGSGKSRTSLAYYKKNHSNKKLYIITTAKKRDSHEWEPELILFDIQAEVIDSWNNIKKYRGVTNGFFIFDEQRVVGYGAWTKNFLFITKHNPWILLSATPGDTWLDYIPVFLANGFYRTKTEFIERHVVYSRYSKYPKVDRYFDIERLRRLRERILVDIDYHNNTNRINKMVEVPYDILAYKSVVRFRKNPETGLPISNASEYCQCLRKIVNSDPSRAKQVIDIYNQKYRIIVFYNYDYELDILKALDVDCEIAEWNGHKHQPIPDTDKWIYLVQYNAGSEGWNCTLTDTIIFYSQNYSYRQVEQASGRIDRRNTPFNDLYYYHLVSKAPIDIVITRALKNKKKFNESSFCKNLAF